MNVLRGAIGVLALAVLIVALWAAFAQRDLHGGFLDQFAVLTTLPWGKATLVDLYAGFFLFAAVVYMTERSWLVATAWAAPVLLLGNFWAALWFLLRLPSLAKRLSRPD
jgi:hypothetical protein